MSNIAHTAAPIAASRISSTRSDHSDFVPVAIFSGIGLLVSLVAVLFGVQGVWL